MPQFDKNSCERITHVVKTVEGWTRNATDTARRRPTRGPLGFWAKIGQHTGKRYSWRQLEALPLDETDVLGLSDDLGYGNKDDEAGFAFEITGSETVLEGDIVWMMPAIGQDYYVFEYSPGSRFAKVGSSDINAGTLATVTLLELDKTTHHLDYTTKTVQAFNWTSGKVKANRQIIISYSHHDGAWAIVSEDCSGA